MQGWNDHKALARDQQRWKREDVKRELLKLTTAKPPEMEDGARKWRGRKYSLMVRWNRPLPSCFSTGYRVVLCSKFPHRGVCSYRYCGRTRLFPLGEVWCFDHDIWGKGARNWLLQILRTGSNLRELTWFWMVSFLVVREYGFTSALFRYSTYVSNKILTECEFSMCEPV